MVQNDAAADSKAAKKKRNKKNKKSGQRTPIEAGNATGPEDDKPDVDEEDIQDDDNTPPLAASPNTEDVVLEKDTPAATAVEDAAIKANELALRNGTSTDEARPQAVDENTETAISSEANTAARLDAIESERNTLREQVTELRKSLQSLQNKHTEELQDARKELENANSAKDGAEEQYRSLLGKVGTIRSQLGERLKADAEELGRARSQIDEARLENERLHDANADQSKIIERLTTEQHAHADELANVRKTTNLSTSNWSKERDELNSKLAYAREEFENAKQAMQDWEVLAMEERSRRETYGERVAQLEEQLAAHREAYERATEERDKQQNSAHGLQRALQDMQEARKTELREMVESTQGQLEALRKQVDEAVTRATESASQLEATKRDLERAQPFEKEVKEKNLLVGKLRHEAVILNDHLTKALKFLKRGKPEDNVDRQIVTNHLLHFLALDRSDPKKFQVLQLIAALLGWSDEQREQAGLARPGASNTQLRIPLSPFRRTPSTPALAEMTSSPGDYRSGSIGGRTSRDSLAELWSDFLEREAEVGGTPTPGADGLGIKERTESMTPQAGR